MSKAVSHLAAALVGGALFWLASGPGRGLLPVVGRCPDPLSAPPGRFSWSRLPEPAFPIPPFARYLGGVRIVLDPGHGGRAGRAGWKRGPTGLREAQVNLRVAQFLREFLAAVGAEVVLTRQRDVYLDRRDGVDLEKRAALANDLPADLLLSIHHNAAETPSANYTALFFHGAADENPASLCAARYLLSGLDQALRLPDHLPCAVLSDALLYPEGLALLRQARVPAVLCEASFHSNPRQERRLRDPLYNRREAYGLFLGLARWARDGLPRLRLLRPADGRPRRGQPIVIELDDGLSGRGGWGGRLPKLLWGSVVARLDGRPLPFTLEPQRRRLRLRLPAGYARRACRLYVDFENLFGQHVLHPWIELRPAPAARRGWTRRPVAGG